MEIRFHESVESFQDEVMPLLMEREAEHNGMLGAITRLLAGEVPGESFLISIADNGKVVAACSKTPFRGLMVTRLPEGISPMLAACLRERLTELTGVMGPGESGRAFASAWSALNGVPTRLRTRMRAYQLEQVVPAPPVPGSMQRATLADREKIEDWSVAMVEECHMSHPDTRGTARLCIEKGMQYLWRDGDVVAMAQARHGTPNGARVGMVYTPPECRGHGYASALVAALSQRMLDSGCRFCFLFTDLDNPTSNSIYQKIGYRPVSDFEEYAFGE